MKTARKAILLVLCVVLLVVSSVLGTLAYLTANDTVTNTFTVGKVALKLDEAKVNEMGDPLLLDGTKAEKREDAVRWEPNEQDLAQVYHLLPNHSYTKDPTVTVLKDSDDSYVRMIVKIDKIAQLKQAFPENVQANAGYYVDLNNDGTTDFALEKLLNNSWNFNQWHFNNYKEVDGVGVYEFRYHKIVNTRAKEGVAAADLKLEPLFTTINIPGEIKNAELAQLQNIKVIVEAHAIQADGFADAAEAWGHFLTT